MSSSFLTEFFRLPPELLPIREDTGTSGGFFQLEEKLLCFGGLNGGPLHKSPVGAPDREVFNGDSEAEFSFNATAAVENLRLERYTKYAGYRTAGPPLVNSVYYSARPWLPVRVRRQLQRFHFRNWQSLPFPRWPVDTTVEELARLLLLRSMERLGLDRVPFVWFWPEGYRSCTILTHDVEAQPGLDTITQIVDMDESFGIPCSVHFMREGRYQAPLSLIEELKNRGVEVNVHGLNHDGHLFRNRRLFEERAARINEFGRQIGARGFRSPVMYRNPDWFHLLDFEYDLSIPTVAHLDPQQGGCCTVFPFRIGEMLELPLTTVQDYTLFNILNDYSTGVWDEQIRRITVQNGLLSFATHPDYLCDDRSRSLYKRLLETLQALIAEDHTWAVMPAQVNDWWRRRENLAVESDGSNYRIEPHCPEARLAWAVRDKEQLRYEVESDVAV